MLLLLILVCTALLVLIDRFRGDFARHPYSRLSLPQSYLCSSSHIVILGYIYLHYFVMLVLLPVILPSTGASLWHSPFFAPVSLSVIFRLMASAVLTYTCVSYVFRPFRHHRLRVADSLVASFEIVFVCSTFFAVPHYSG